MITINVNDIYRLPNHRGHIKAFPATEKTKQQQIILGDDQGFLHILECVGDVLKVDSKQQVSQKEISFIDTTNSQNERDRILVGSGQIVLGLTRKLRNYFTYDTQSADIIRFVAYEGQSFFTAGEFMLNEYQATNDRFNPVSFFLCPDRINCMQVHYLSKLNVILGCQDSCIRVLQQDNVLYIVQVTSPVICMHVFAPEYREMAQPSRAEQRKCFIYALEDGTIFAADMGMERATILFTFKVQSVACFKPYNFLRTAFTDLLVARSDGMLELYTFDDGVQLKAQKKINEGITSIEAGYFHSGHEFMVSTYSGRIILIREQQLQHFKDDKKSQKEQEMKLKVLRNEVDELNQQITACRNKGDMTGMNKFKLSHKIIEKNGLYIVTIDCQYPIEMITLSTDLPIEQKCYIIKDKTSNYELQLPLMEGQAGQIICFVTPHMLQCCQSIVIDIKPLSLHQSVNPINIKGLPLSSLNLKGQFTMSDMSLWMHQLVPDLANTQEDTVTYLLRNNVTETYLHVKFKQGQAIFKSDSVIAIRICKQYIIQQANKRGIQLDIKWECNDQSVVDMLNKLKSQQIDQESVQKQYAVLPALKEITIDNDITILSQEFQAILKQEKQLEQKFKELPSKIKYLEDIVIDIYKSRCHLKGLDVYDQNIETIKMFWKKDIKELLQYVLK